MTRDEFNTIIVETLDAMKLDESSKEENAPNTWGLEYDLCKDMSLYAFREMCLKAVRGWKSFELAEKAQYN